MKIAAITDDVQTISRHFGRAVHYLVVIVEDGKIADRQMRDKPGCSRFVAQLHETGHFGRLYSGNTTFHHEHCPWAESIADCEVLLCGDMEISVYEGIKVRGIRPIVTDIAEIDKAVIAYVRGEITDQQRTCTEPMSIDRPGVVGGRQ